MGNHTEARRSDCANATDARSAAQRACAKVSDAPGGGMLTAAPARLRTLAFALTMAAALACALFAVAATPGQAHAAWTHAQSVAYQRSVKAINNYKHQPKSISVNVKDLHLSYKQICAVYDKVHYDGRYFWVNTFGNPPKTTKSITYTCYLSDSQITKLRRSMAKRIKAAKKWAPKEMSSAQRIHMLHDWLIRHSNYVYDGNLKHKYAIGTLVYKKGDCLSYALGMRVLLREAGFKTCVALDHSKKGSYHVWVRVKFGGKWYNVDPTWDNSYTGRYFWVRSICHKYLLRNDWYMGQVHKQFITTDKHAGQLYAAKYANTNWEKLCHKHLSKGSIFSTGGTKYRVTGAHSVKAVGGKHVKKGKRIGWRGYVYTVKA